MGNPDFDPINTYTDNDYIVTISLLEYRELIADKAVWVNRVGELEIANETLMRINDELRTQLQGFLFPEDTEDSPDE